MPDAVAAFAPATVANLGIGFDVLGLALTSPGDVVVARRASRPGVSVDQITGDRGRLPKGPANTAAIAGLETLRLAEATGVGVSLSVHKQMPIGSGLGSSAASAAAAAYAVNALLGSPLPTEALIGPCIEAEAQVSGRHADNVAPSLLGGLVLVRAHDPLDWSRLPVPPGLEVAVVTPVFEVSTKRAREVLPKTVPMAVLVERTANLGAFVSACYAGDLELMGRSMTDDLVTPARASLIPGCEAVMAAARGAGALSSSLSGSGPSVFALCRTGGGDAAASAMKRAFAAAGLEASAVVSPADCPGARLVDPPGLPPGA